MKKIIIVSLITCLPASYLCSMEQKPSPIDQDEAQSLWDKLPTELQDFILLKVSLQEASSFEKVLQKANDLKKSRLFAYLVSNPNFNKMLAKQYVKRYPARAEKELLSAIEESKQNLVQKLIDGNVNVNAIDKNGEPALTRAIMRSKKIAKMLINAGANVNAQDIDGHTALHFVSEKNLAQRLLDKGAAINTKETIFGNTPLMEHIGHGNQDMVEFLLERGADPNIVNNNGKTALAFLQNLIPRKMHSFREKLNQIIPILKRFGAH